MLHIELWSISVGCPYVTSVPESWKDLFSISLLLFWSWPALPLKVTSVPAAYDLEGPSESYCYLPLDCPPLDLSLS